MLCEEEPEELPPTLRTVTLFSPLYSENFLQEMKRRPSSSSPLVLGLSHTERRGRPGDAFRSQCGTSALAVWTQCDKELKVLLHPGHLEVQKFSESNWTC